MPSAGASLAKTGRSSQSIRWCESLAVPTAAPTGMPGPPQLQHRALGSPLGGSVPGGLHLQLVGGCSMWQSRSLRTPSPGVPTCALLSFPWQQAPGWSIPRSALAGGREPGHCSLPPEPWVLATRGWVLLHFCCTCSSSCLKQHQCPAGAVTAEPASAASLLLHLFNLTWGFSTAFLPGKKKNPSENAYLCR